MSQPLIKNNTTLILPAAGYGTRMAADVASGKELMEDPCNYGRPLIEWSLQLGRELGWKILVISRKDKTELNEYIAAQLDVDLLVLEKPGQEWPDTILASKDSWTAFNVMVLPDTRFPHSLEVMQALRTGLVSDPIKLATFTLNNTDDAKNFAVREEEYLAEKPLHGETKEVRGVGIFGFRQSAGSTLFEIFSDKNNWHSSSLLGADVRLEWFKDITRNGVVEGYNNECANNY